MSRFFGECLAAAITSAVAITYLLSAGALIFAGPLRSELSFGITSMLVLGAVSGIIVALTSSFRFAIAGSNSTAILATIAATIAETMPRDPARAAHHVLLVLMLSGLAGGGVLVALGSFRMGHWIRYIPYPIVAGFLAANGWLMLNGSLRVIADVSFPAHLDRALTPNGAERLLAGCVFAAILYATRRIRNPLKLPALLLAASVALTGGFALAGRLAQARADGWLAPAFGAPQFTSVVLPAAYTGISWHIIGALGPAIATAIIVTVLVILFGAAGLEAQTGVDGDLDRELRSSGLASIASALCGGTLGSIAAGRSILNHNVGAQTRVAGVLVGLACAAVLAGGSPIVALIPQPVLGGLLLYLGYTMLSEWLITSWRQLALTEVALVATIVVVTGVSSFLSALIIGLIFSCVSFVIRYARFRVVRHALTASNKHSRVERAMAERRALETHGDQIRMLLLQGYIFFGTANSVLEEARAHLHELKTDRASYLVLDFRAVTGLDTSAAKSFAKITALAKRAGTNVLFSSLTDAAREVLLRAGGVEGAGGHGSIFADLDHALEWCEDDLLARVAAGQAESVRDWLGRELGGTAQAETFLSYFDEVEVDAGKTLFRQGDPSDALFVVESGRLRVSIHDSGGERRLRSMVAGSFIGEMGLFSSEPRSADVIAEQNATLLRLTQAALTRMNEHDPSLAAAFHGLLFRLQAERLRFASAEIAALEA